MNHELKIRPDYYREVVNGSKTFEVGKHDRKFEMGDTVMLREWDTVNKKYTGSKDLIFTIGYIYPVSLSEVIFSLLPHEGEK